MLYIADSATSDYHPQSSGKTERYNRTILHMLRYYIVENQRDWDTYVHALNFSSNTAVPRGTDVPPLYLVLSKAPSDFTVQLQGQRTQIDVHDRRHAYNQRIEDTVTPARDHLTKAQARYRREFDKRVKPANEGTTVGKFVYI